MHPATTRLEDVAQAVALAESIETAKRRAELAKLRAESEG